MDQRLNFRTISAVALLALFAGACSSTGTSRVSMDSMCKSSGGTYSNGACQPAASPLTAAQMCAAHGGVYMAGGDYCEVDNSLLWKP
jgi:hypothetical protein